MAMVGADADELDRIAEQLANEARRLEELAAQLGHQLNAAPWKGSDSERFRHEWNMVHTKRVREAGGFLRAGGDTLRRNADEQRTASNSDGLVANGPRCEVPKKEPVGDEIDKYLEPFEDFFTGLGLAKDVWEGVVKILRMLDPDLLKDLGKFLAGNPELLTFFKTMDKALSIGPVVIDFLTDVTKQLGQGHLPMDEALLHAMVFSGLRFAEDKGLEEFGKVLGASLGSAIPVLGTAGGGALGWVAGKGLGLVLDSLDDKFGINEGAADAAVDAYRDVKEVAGAVGDFVGDVKDELSDSWDDMKDAAGDLKDGVENVLSWDKLPWN